MTRAKLVSRMLTLATLAFLTGGCGNRAILEQPGTVCFHRKALENVPMLVPDKDGNLTPALVNIPEGAATVVPLKQLTPGMVVPK